MPPPHLCRLCRPSPAAGAHSGGCCSGGRRWEVRVGGGAVCSTTFVPCRWLQFARYCSLQAAAGGKCMASTLAARFVLRCSLCPPCFKQATQPQPTPIAHPAGSRLACTPTRHSQRVTSSAGSTASRRVNFKAPPQPASYSRNAAGTSLKGISSKQAATTSASKRH